MRQNNSLSALGTHKGTVGSCLKGKLSDALFAVVKAREDLRVPEVFLTNREGDLLLQLLQTLFYGTWSFHHATEASFEEERES